MILIRADANEQIGTGHIMRCLSIAQAFVERGEEVIFVTADHRGDFLISLQGFQSICLNSVWTDMENENLNWVIARYKPELLILDSYYVTESYLRKLRDVVRTVYLDDLNKWKLSIDILINYNIFANFIDYSGYDSTELLLGTKFVPLRAEFRRLPVHIIHDKIENVLISAGGTDPVGIIEKFISELCSRWPDVSFHFILGSLNPRIEEIKRKARQNVVLHINEPNISGLMQKCDVAISAAGITLYELCACGIPTITFTLADNQLLAADEFAKQEIMINLGDCRGNYRFVDAVDDMLRKMTKEKRSALSESMHSLVDGNGAERIVLHLLVQLIPAEETDFNDYYEIKCGRSEILWMGYAGIPEQEMMKQIFLSRLGNCSFEHNGDKRIYMIKVKGQNVGMIQMSLCEEGIEFGLSVKETEQKKGYASTAMQKAVVIARQYSQSCFAHIRDDNIRSIQACMSAGLKPTDEVEERLFPQTGIINYRKYEL